MNSIFSPKGRSFLIAISLLVVAGTYNRQILGISRDSVEAFRELMNEGVQPSAPKKPSDKAQIAVNTKTRPSVTDTKAINKVYIIEGSSIKEENKSLNEAPAAKKASESSITLTLNDAKSNTNSILESPKKDGFIDIAKANQGKIVVGVLVLAVGGYVAGKLTGFIG